ncbi:MAG: ribonuclease P protein component [Marivirga sp.]|jgi:ribonuclease P protein component
MSENLTDNHSFSFKKKECLSSRKIIQELFDKGSSFYLFPFKVIYLENPLFLKDQTTPHQVLISVPKRKFKRAVDRNLLKRRIREGYRLNKSILSPIIFQKAYLIAYIYTTDKVLPQATISKKLIAVLDRLKQTN